jgi:acyl-coenzyme A synthetase/AMP-(fatty) acid ligase
MTRLNVMENTTLAGQLWEALGQFEKAEGGPSFEGHLYIDAKSAPEEILQGCLDSWKKRLCPVFGTSADLSLFENLPQKEVVLSFATSGTTGSVSKIVTKTASQLLSEAKVLAPLLNLTERSSVLSIVSPGHLYGFLCSVLAPALACVSKLSYGSTLNLFEATDTDITHMIATASQSKAINGFLQSCQGQNLKTIVVSGAPFSQKHFEQVTTHTYSQKQLNQPSVEIIDLLGSTETGGIGYRRLTNHFLHLHSLLPSVQMKQDDCGVWLVRAPWTESSPVMVGDEFEWVDQSKGIIKHLGRRDGVFKYAGQRFHVVQIKSVLEKILNDAETFVHFYPDEAHPKGGRLTAWIEMECVDRRSLMTKIRDGLNQASIHLPVPEVIHLVPTFPRGPAGKVALGYLELNAQ